MILNAVPGNINCRSFVLSTNSGNWRIESHPAFQIGCLCGGSRLSPSRLQASYFMRGLPSFVLMLFVKRKRLLVSRCMGVIVRRLVISRTDEGNYKLESWMVGEHLHRDQCSRVTTKNSKCGSSSLTISISAAFKWRSLAISILPTLSILQ